MAMVLAAVAALTALAVLGRAIGVRPQRGILVLAALAPFDGLLVLVDDPGLLAGWKEALTVITLGATWLAPAKARRGRLAPAPAFVGPLLGLVALGLASLLWAPPPFVLLGLKIDFFYVLVGLAIWRCPLDRAERDRLVSILMIGAAVTAGFGLAQQRIGAFGLRDLGYEFGRSIRTTGDSLRSFSTFDLPFGFAFYLVFVLALATPVALAAPSDCATGCSSCRPRSCCWPCSAPSSGPPRSPWSWPPPTCWSGGTGRSRPWSRSPSSVCS